MKFLLAISICLLPSLAIAQEQQPPSPSQTALAVNQAVSNLALALEGAQRQITALQAENVKLKSKCGDACKDK